MPYLTPAFVIMRIFTNHPHGFDPSLTQALHSASHAGAAFAVRCIHRESPRIAIHALADAAHLPLPTSQQTLAPIASAHISPPEHSDDAAQQAHSFLLPESRWSKLLRLLARHLSAPTTLDQRAVDQALVSCAPFLHSFLPSSFYRRIDLSIVHPNGAFQWHKPLIQTAKALHHTGDFFKSAFWFGKDPFPPSKHIQRLEHLVNDNNVRKGHIRNTDSLQGRYFIALGTQIPFSIDPLKKVADAQDLPFILFHEIGHAVTHATTPAHMEPAQQLTALGVDHTTASCPNDPAPFHEQITTQRVALCHQLRQDVWNKLTAFANLSLGDKRLLLSLMPDLDIPMPSNTDIVCATLGASLHQSLSNNYHEMFADTFAICANTSYQGSFNPQLIDTLAHVRTQHLSQNRLNTYTCPQLNQHLFDEISTVPYFGHHTSAALGFTRTMIEHLQQQAKVHSTNPQPNTDAPNQEGFKMDYQSAKNIAHISADLGWVRAMSCLYLADPSFAQSLCVLHALDLNPDTNTLSWKSVQKRAQEPTLETLLKQGTGTPLFEALQVFSDKHQQCYGLLDHIKTATLFSDDPTSASAQDYFERLQLTERNWRAQRFLTQCAQLYTHEHQPDVFARQFQELTNDLSQSIKSQRTNATFHLPTVFKHPLYERCVHVANGTAQDIVPVLENPKQYHTVLDALSTIGKRLGKIRHQKPINTSSPNPKSTPNKDTNYF